MSILEFDDGIGGRLRGTLHAPGATPGDVLTVGATRGAISPSPGGGSPPYVVRTIRVPLAFNTPGILTGIPAWEPAAGDVLLAASGFSIPTTVWDAQSGFPRISVYPRGQDHDAKAIMQGSLDALDFAAFPSCGFTEWSLSFDSNENGQINAAKPAQSDGTAFDVIVDDGAGGDPGSTQGAGELVLFIVTP